VTFRWLRPAGAKCVCSKGVRSVSSSKQRSEPMRKKSGNNGRRRRRPFKFDVCHHWRGRWVLVTAPKVQLKWATDEVPAIAMDLRGSGSIRRNQILLHSKSKRMLVANGVVALTDRNSFSNVWHFPTRHARKVAARLEEVWVGLSQAGL
jgi:hypothetical protein